MSTTAVSTPRRKSALDELSGRAAKTIGARLRSLRKTQRVTLVRLAQDAGVDIATISRIETGQMTGTLQSHLKLATALGVKLTDLYASIEEARTKDAVSVQRPSQRGDVYLHHAGKASMMLLTTDVMKRKLMPMLITIEPGGSTHPEEARVGTERFLYLFEGALDVKVGEAVHRLPRGSSLYFDASIAHQLKNAGKRTARCLSIITPPAL